MVESSHLGDTAQTKVKGKGFPYSIPSVGPRADPGVLAVGCHYFPPGLQLPPEPHSITALWPVPSYTAWRQRHIGVNNLPKIVTQRCLKQDLNPRPTDRKPKCLTVAPPRHLRYGRESQLHKNGLWTRPVVQVNSRLMHLCAHQQHR